MKKLIFLNLLIFNFAFQSVFVAAIDTPPEETANPPQETISDEASAKIVYKDILPTHEVKESKACKCPEILKGVAKPTDCKIFGNICTPTNPIGSCMVSSEGFYRDWETDRKSTRLNSSHRSLSRMPSSA